MLLSRYGLHSIILTWHEFIFPLPPTVATNSFHFLLHKYTHARTHAHTHTHTGDGNQVFRQNHSRWQVAQPYWLRWQEKKHNWYVGVCKHMWPSLFCECVCMHKRLPVRVCLKHVCMCVMHMRLFKFGCLKLMQSYTHLICTWCFLCAFL